MGEQQQRGLLTGRAWIQLTCKDCFSKADFHVRVSDARRTLPKACRLTRSLITLYKRCLLTSCVINIQEFAARLGLVYCLSDFQAVNLSVRYLIGSSSW